MSIQSYDLTFDDLLEKLHYKGADELRYQADIDKAINALAKLGTPDAILALIAYFERTSSKAFHRRILHAVGGLYDGLVLNFLIEVASHDEPDLREIAVSKLLTWFPYERVVEPLFAALGRLRRQGVWYQIVTALAQSDDPEHIRRLRAYLTSDDPAYRCAALVAIRLLNLPELAPVMLVLLRNDPDTDIRSRAAQALAEARHPDIVKAFVDALDDPEYSVRSAAFYGLIRQGDPRGIEPLRARCDFLATDSRATRHELMDCLGALSALSGGEPVDFLIELLQRPDLRGGVYAAAVDRLSHLTSDQWEHAAPQVHEALPMLIRMLEDEEHARTHFSIIQIMGSLKAPEAVEPLCHMLMTHLSHKLTHYLIHALGEIGDAGAVPTLIAALGHTELDDMVLRALKKIGTPEALAAIAAYST